ncbi:MAG: PDZ domain-containing protein, partial [Pirellulaceae bacterium]
MTIMVGFVWLNQKLIGPPVPGQGEKDGVEVVEGGGDGEGEGEKDGAEDNVGADDGTADNGTGGPKTTDTTDNNDTGADEPVVETPAASQEEWVVVGSFTGKKLPYVAYFSNRGASLDRLELVERNKDGRFTYRALEHRSGYLGFMGLQDLLAGGCLVRVMAPGSPVATATSPDVAPGLQPGDIILAVDGTDVATMAELDSALAESKAGQKVLLTVRRPVANTAGEEKEPTDDSEPAGDEQRQPLNLDFTVVLVEKPLALIGDDSEDAPPKLRSAFTLAISKFNDEDVSVSTWEPIGGGESLESKFWNIVRDKGKNEDNDEDSSVAPTSVRFRTTYVNGDDKIEIEKIFRFSLPTGDELKLVGSQYHFDYQIRARTVSNTKPEVGFRIDGPRGLPTDGWWYTNKIHPRFFASAGIRDVTWNVFQGGHLIRGTRKIYSTALEDAQKKDAQKTKPFTPIFVDGDSADRRSLRYIGVDTPYFNVSLLPHNYADDDDAKMRFSKAAPVSATDTKLIE